MLSFRVASEATLLGRALALPPDAQASAETIVPANGRFVPYLWVEAEAELSADELVGDSTPLGELTELLTEGNAQLFQLTWRDVSDRLFEAIRAEDGAITSLQGNAENWDFHVRFPSEPAISAFHKRCREEEIRIDVTRLSQPLMRGGGSDATTPQQEALQAALERGYYDVPRRVTLNELAEEFGISDSAFSQLLRRGNRNILHEEFREMQDRT